MVVSPFFARSSVEDLPVIDWDESDEDAFLGYIYTTNLYFK